MSSSERERILALYQTYSAGVIAELLGLTRSKVAGIIDRARNPTRNLRPRQRRGRKPTPCYKHKTRFTRRLPPEGGVFQRGG